MHPLLSRKTPTDACPRKLITFRGLVDSSLEIDSSEISEVVKSVIAGIEDSVAEGSTGYALATSIKFQIGLRSKKDRLGNLKLHIVGIGASHTKEETARVEFEISDYLTVITQKFDELQKSPSGRLLLENIAKMMPKDP
jgi:hypothetical protein